MPKTYIAMVFIHVYHSKAWLVDDYRDPALETNITTTVRGAATRDPLFEPDPKTHQKGEKLGLIDLRYVLKS